MKINLILALPAVLSACTLIGCPTIKAQTKILKQATYVLDSAARTDTGWAPPKAIPKPADMTMHLEVIVVDGGRYDLRGWLKIDTGAKHSTLPINSGRVDSDGNPHMITWQSTVMGESNNDWLLFFQDAGRLEIMDADHHIDYYFHQQNNTF